MNGQHVVQAVDVEGLLGDMLLQIENPARYVGGEYHYGTKDIGTVDFFTAICFPDLYEIGMSNNAVRILYDILNRNEHVFCDRVFSVSHDFERLLRTRGVPLYTLDRRIALKELDLLCISIGYELAATNILQILDLGGIPLHADDRNDDSPIVICGGPAATNPLPFSRFVDFVYIGEAENGLNELVEVLRACKKRNATKSEKLHALSQFDFLWYPGKKVALRAIDTAFSEEGEDHLYQYFVVPNFKVAQDNGVVEIMRGCPNSCRFCHAGQYYKPYRQKTYATIQAQVEQNVQGFGYREVTLSSLSSGDHPYIKELIERLNATYSDRHISFSLPSLKVSSFSLGILEQLSEVRKSGLTFAIETPLPQWQRAVNKEVPVDNVIDIIHEAKRRGWKLAKFYFMVGLPFTDRQMECQAIVDFLGAIYDATRIQMNINIGTFIPKAHTPFQWCAQLHPQTAGDHLRAIKREITERVRGCKVSYHEPDISYIEGLISRGDGHTCELIETAYLLGCRLDAWDEHLRKDLWAEAIARMDFDPDQFIFIEHPLEEPLPWDDVSMRVSKEFLKQEYRKAREAVLTPRCTEDCDHRCGVCGRNATVRDVGGCDAELDQVRAMHDDEARMARPQQLPAHSEREAENVRQVLFTYRKCGRALYISHISTMRMFEMAFQRSGLEIEFSQGYNPKPRLEFVNPLSVGFEGTQEVFLAELRLPSGTEQQEIRKRLQENLSDGFIILDSLILDLDKKTTLAKHMAGSVFVIGEITDPSITERLEYLFEHMPLTTDYTLTRLDTGTSWKVAVHGEKNLVKLLFGDAIDKFVLCSRCKIIRIGLQAGSMDTDYHSYFSAIMDRSGKKSGEGGTI